MRAVRGWMCESRGAAAAAAGSALALARVGPGAAVRGALGRVLGSPGLGVAHVELLEGRQPLLQGLERRGRELGAVQVQLAQARQGWKLTKSH